MITYSFSLLKEYFMRFPFTDEMHELEKIFKPYKEGCHLVETAPKEAIEAWQEYCRLFEIEKEKNSDIDLL